MNKIILIVGGARAGKSSFAEKLACQKGRQLLYLATAEARDKEMSARIRKHKRRRGKKWKLIEEPVNLAGALARVPLRTEVVLFDCVTLWLSNLLLAGRKKIKQELKSLLAVLKKAEFTTIIVSNEVGSGIVPENCLAREYRDLLGKMNQLIANEADLVYHLCCGIPLKIKGGADGED